MDDVKPVVSLPRGTPHPVTKLALSYLREIPPETLVAASDFINEGIRTGEIIPEMGSVSETLTRVVNRDGSVSDRYLNSAAFYLLYNSLLANGVPHENTAS